MRIVIFLLLFVKVYSQPSNGCRGAGSKCSLSDFNYNEEDDKQCYYKEYDLGFSPWKNNIVALNGKESKRIGCPWPLTCSPIGRGDFWWLFGYETKQILHYRRKVNIGDDKHAESKVNQNATVASTIADPAIRDGALKYFNRDLCFFNLGAFLWSLAAIVVAGIIAYFVIKKCIECQRNKTVADEFIREIKEEKVSNKTILNNKTPYKSRERRVFLGYS